MTHTFSAFKIQNGDVVKLTPQCFTGDTKKLKPGTKIRINDQHSFSIAKNGDCVFGMISKYYLEFYNLKEVLKIIYMFLTRKPKQEFIELEVTNAINPE